MSWEYQCFIPPSLSFMGWRQQQWTFLAWPPSFDRQTLSIIRPILSVGHFTNPHCTSLPTSIERFLLSFNSSTQAAVGNILPCSFRERFSLDWLQYNSVTVNSSFSCGIFVPSRSPFTATIGRNSCRLKIRLVLTSSRGRYVWATHVAVWVH